MKNFLLRAVTGFAASLVVLAAAGVGALLPSAGQDADAAAGKPLVLDPDSLISSIERYEGEYVEIEGLIVHFCGAGEKKLMLRTAGEKIIRIVPAGEIERFDPSLKDKRVRVRGIATETRYDESYIMRMEKGKEILCSIDHTPCIAKDWIEKQRAEGKADSMSIRTTERMRRLMDESGKDYVSVITVGARWLEVTSR